MTFINMLSISLRSSSPAYVDIFQLTETSTLFIDTISSRMKKAKGFFRKIATLSAFNTAASAISLRIEHVKLVV